jgi:hypothetical protein
MHGNPLAGRGERARPCVFFFFFLSSRGAHSFIFRAWASSSAPPLAPSRCLACCQPYNHGVGVWVRGAPLPLD